MRKHWFLLATYLLFALSVLKAQEFNAAVYTGMVASQVDGDTHAGYNKAGLVLGGYVNRFLTKELAGQMGIQYIQKGSKRADDDLQIYYKTQFHYIEMPLTIRYFYIEKIDFEGGMAVGYLFKGLESRNNSLILEETRSDQTYNSLDISLVAGVSYELTAQITASAHFTYSLIPIRPFFDNMPNIRGGQYNNVLHFTLAYKLSSWK